MNVAYDPPARRRLRPPRHRVAIGRGQRVGYVWLVLLIGAALVIADGLRERPGPEAERPAAQPGRTATTPAPARTTPPAPSPTARARDDRVRPASRGPQVDLSRVEFLSWAVLDRRSGAITGSPNLAAPSDTMSMIKAWLAADFLRLADERGQPPSSARLRQLSIMIRDSDNAAAETVYGLVGGRASIERLVRICGLTESRPYHRPYWSNTVVSARDTVRMGACLADGRGAGRRWTGWLLSEMRRVRGTGDFGVRTALPDDVAATVAIKNGWLLRDEDGLWHISCLAVATDWAISVLARYPGRLGFGYGTQLCRQVGAPLVPSA